MDYEFLKKRAKEFLEEALELKEKGKYNLSAFNLEQACQLWLKYLLAKKVGEFPKTHYFLTLVKEFSKVYENKEILDFYWKNELFFDDLEDAYFTSRYFPKVFTENLVDQLIQGAKKFFKLTEKITKEKFL